MNPLIQLTRAIFVFLVTLACFGLSAAGIAVSPPPEGGYPNQNTAEGDNALLSLTTGANNTAAGNSSLSGNTMGNGNTAVGCQALESNTMGSRNTATGLNALEENTTGMRNTAYGYNALYHSSGSDNIALGANAGVYVMTGDSNIDIGNGGIPGTGKIRIGTPGVHTGISIAGICDVPVTGSPVVVNSNGKLGVSTSSAQFKEEIKSMDEASEAILALRPVTFRYKKEIDPARVQQFGLVAEQVEKVNPDLVVRDKGGKPYSVRYDQVNAMLLNEFLKEHRKVQQLEKQIEALAAGLQKVSAQLELNRAAPQTVLSDH